MGVKTETVRRWTAAIPPAPGEALRVRGLRVGVVEELDGETIMLRLDQKAMTVRLPLSAVKTRLVRLVPARRLRPLLRTLGEEPGAPLSRLNHARSSQLHVLLLDGEPSDWIALLRSYATTANAAKGFGYPLSDDASKETALQLDPRALAPSAGCEKEGWRPHRWREQADQALLRTTLV